MRLDSMRPSVGALARFAPIGLLRGLLVSAVVIGLAGLIGKPLFCLAQLVIGRGFSFSPQTMEAFANTGLMSVLSALLAAMVALPMAWLTDATDVRFGAILRQAILVTLLVPSFAFALGWQALGLTLPSLLQTAVVLATVGFAPIYLAATSALRSISADVDSAARMHGIARQQRFRALWDSVKPAIMVAMLLSVMRAACDLGAPLFMAAPSGIPTLATEVLFDVERGSLSSSGASAALLMLLISGSVFVCAGLACRRNSEQRDDIGHLSISLGSWRWAATLLGLVVVMTLIVAPLVALIVTARFSYANLLAPAFTTLTVAAIVASAVLVLAGTVTILVGRLLSRPNPLLMSVCRLQTVVPALIFAVGVLAAYKDSVSPGVLLVVALTALALPAVLLQLNHTLQAVPPDQKEAARQLGIDPMRIVRTVLWPQLLPRVVGCWVIVFVACCRELSASLLLASPALRPLAAESAMQARVGKMEQAAALAVVLIVIGALALGLVRRLTDEPVLMQVR